MADQKNKITRYVTGDMDEDEEIAFEAEMADNDDLRLHVQLEQLRFANIQRRVSAALEADDLKKMPSSTEEGDLMPDAISGRGLKVVFSKLKTNVAWRWAAAAIFIGLAVGIWFIATDTPDQAIADEGKKTEQEKEIVPPDSTVDSSVAIIKHDDKIIVAGTAPAPADTGLSTAISKRKTLYAPSYYTQLVQKIYKRYKKEIETASEDEAPPLSTDEHELAFLGYVNKDSAIVYAYYEKYPDDRRAVEWKARYLLENDRFEEAAPLFAQLKTFRKRKSIGEWNELLCYAALYPSHKKEFHELAAKIKRDGRHHQQELAELLKQIR